MQWWHWLLIYQGVALLFVGFTIRMVHADDPGQPDAADVGMAAGMMFFSSLVMPVLLFVWILFPNVRRKSR